jgi:hypothetical protein
MQTRGVAGLSIRLSLENGVNYDGGLNHRYRLRSPVSPNSELSRVRGSPTHSKNRHCRSGTPISALLG